MFATRVRTRRRSFATARPIAKLKPPLCSAESKLPIGVKIPFSTKCSEWVIYAEPVTYRDVWSCNWQTKHNRIEEQLKLSELSVVLWVSSVEGCPLSGVPLYCAHYGTISQCENIAGFETSSEIFKFYIIGAAFLIKYPHSIHLCPYGGNGA